MISQKAKIVVIDDQEAHLNAVVDCLKGEGTICLPHLYTDAFPPAEMLSGVRVIFCDVHLAGSRSGTDLKIEIANICQFLSTSISDTNGPYLLVIWSQFAQGVSGHLDNYLPEIEEARRPISYSVIDKNDHLDFAEQKARDPGSLGKAVTDAFEATPAIQAVLAWEAAVSSAAADAISMLFGLVASGDSDVSRSLSSVLGVLAESSTNTEYAKSHPGKALTLALNPLLADKVEHGPIAPNVNWQEAVSIDDVGPLKIEDVSSLNSVLHVDNTVDEIEPTGRGAVCKLPDSARRSEQHFKALLGYSPAELAKGFRLKEQPDPDKWVLIQIQAACDEAQGSFGNLPYALGYLMIADPKKSGEPPRALWHGPEMIVDSKCVKLVAHSGMILGIPARRASKLTVVMRIREQLLNGMTYHLRAHQARQGFVSVPVAKQKKRSAAPKKSTQTPTVTKTATTKKKTVAKKKAGSSKKPAS